MRDRINIFAPSNLALMLCSAPHPRHRYLAHRVNARPFVVLKVALSMDGKVACGDGTSQWITGPEARADGHLLRAQSQAILVGSGTALADKPTLTARPPWLPTGVYVRVCVRTNSARSSE